MSEDFIKEQMFVQKFNRKTFFINPKLTLGYD